MSLLIHINIFMYINLSPPYLLRILLINFLEIIFKNKLISLLDSVYFKVYS
jgi:hypothetical protein